MIAPLWLVVDSVVCFADLHLFRDLPGQGVRVWPRYRHSKLGVTVMVMWLADMYMHNRCLVFLLECICMYKASCVTVSRCFTDVNPLAFITSQFICYVVSAAPPLFPWVAHQTIVRVCIFREQWVFQTSEFQLREWSFLRSNTLKIFQKQNDELSDSCVFYYTHYFMFFVVFFHK